MARLKQTQTTRARLDKVLGDGCSVRVPMTIDVSRSFVKRLVVRIVFTGPSCAYASHHYKLSKAPVGDEDWTGHGTFLGPTRRS